MPDVFFSLHGSSPCGVSRPSPLHNRVRTTWCSPPLTGFCFPDRGTAWRKRLFPSFPPTLLSATGHLFPPLSLLLGRTADHWFFLSQGFFSPALVVKLDLSFPFFLVLGALALALIPPPLLSFPLLFVREKWGISFSLAKLSQFGTGPRR